MFVTVFLQHNLLLRYKRVSKRNNYCVQVKCGSFAEIQYYIVLQPPAIIKLLLPLPAQHFSCGLHHCNEYLHGVIVPVTRSMTCNTISIERIKRKCVLILCMYVPFQTSMKKTRCIFSSITMHIKCNYNSN